MNDPAIDPIASAGRQDGAPRARIGHWPFGVIAVAVLRLLNALTLFIYGLVPGSDIAIGGMPIIGNDSSLTQALDLALATLIVVGVIGLLMFRRWGWVLTMVLVGLSLIGDLIRVAVGEPAFLALLLHVLAAFYLNGRSVRALALQDRDHGGRRDA